MNWNEKLDKSGSFNCLINAFEQMTFQSCLISTSFGIDFQNLAFEIYIPMKNENQFHLLSNKYDLKLQNSFNQIIVDRTNIIKENFHLNLPMMIIDTKFLDGKNQSIILIEQKHHFNSVQTANVTVIFNRQVSCIHIYGFFFWFFCFESLTAIIQLERERNKCISAPSLLMHI